MIDYSREQWEAEQAELKRDWSRPSRADLIRELLEDDREDNDDES